MIQLFSKNSTLDRRLKSIGIAVQYITDITTLDENELIITESTSVEELISFNKTFTIFALTPAPSFQEGTKLLTLGIKGYGNAYMHAKHLRRAIITIKEGNIWLYPAFMQELISSITPSTPKKESSQLETLTARQKETALLVKEGKSNKEIAQALNITERTVKAHISAIFERTGATDRLTLALLI
jgi:DNA-binding NarL/FixJ family response regulator